MQRQRVVFYVFLVVYVLTGLALLIAAYLLHDKKTIADENASDFSRPGRYYLIGIASYILITCVIQLLTSTLCKKKLLFFRLSLILLILGIIIEITVIALIVFLNTGINPDTRKKTMIILGSVTSYLIILQISGVAASLIYLAQLKHDYEQVPLK